MTFKEWKKEHGYTTKKNRHVFSACISCVHCGESGTISPRSPHLMDAFFFCQEAEKDCQLDSEDVKVDIYGYCDKHK